jgi:hypothetical protein
MLEKTDTEIETMVQFLYTQREKARYGSPIYDECDTAINTLEWVQGHQDWLDEYFAEEG